MVRAESGEGREIQTHLNNVNRRGTFLFCLTEPSNGRIDVQWQATKKNTIEEWR